METLVIVVVIVLSLWSITITIEKQTGKMLESHRAQIELLKKIQSKLDEK
ncbi:hypothetical protein [Rossellomorea sp. NPDC077527]